MPGLFGPGGARGQMRRVGRRTSRRTARRQAFFQDQAEDDAPAQPAEATGADVTQQLKELGQLHDSGVLTDQEFAQKKAELLKRL